VHAHVVTNAMDTHTRFNILLGPNAPIILKHVS
jgi:hypothetical protein